MRNATSASNEEGVRYRETPIQAKGKRN